MTEVTSEKSPTHGDARLVQIGTIAWGRLGVGLNVCFSGETFLRLQRDKQAYPSELMSLDRAQHRAELFFRRFHHLLTDRSYFGIVERLFIGLIGEAKSETLLPFA